MNSSSFYLEKNPKIRVLVSEKRLWLTLPPGTLQGAQAFNYHNQGKIMMIGSPVMSWMVRGG